VRRKPYTPFLVTLKNLLLTTYPEAFLKRGGGEMELIEVSEQLLKAGLNNAIYGYTSQNIDRYDGVLHFSVSGSSLPLLQRVKEEATVPVLLWPNFWRNRPLTAEDVARIEAIVALSDYVVVKSRVELTELRTVTSIADDKVIGIDPFVDARFLRRWKLSLFPEMFPVENYLLWVGVLDEAKGQLEFIEAARRLNHRLVFIGGARDNEYMRECQLAGRDRCLFIDEMPYACDLLISAYQNCALYTEFSREPPGTSLLEACALGRPILTPRSPWIDEILGEHALVVDDAYDPQCLLEAVDDAVSREPSGDLVRLVESRYSPLVVFSKFAAVLGAI
jgi:glycosyltransferase involved in cell wall biosynthesis